MTQRTRLLALFLALITALGSFIYIRNGNDLSAPRQPAFSDIWSRIRTAEKFADPGQRCLAYPDPPWLHWSPQVAGAFCRTLSFRYISVAEMKAALDQGHPEVLDQAFQSYFEQNSSVPEKRGILSRAVRSLFYHPSADVESIAQQWVKLEPKSAFALVSRGTYYLAAALGARGEDYIQNTPDENLLRMDQLISQAEADFDAALAINPRMITAYSGLIVAARMTSDRALLGNSVDSAMAIDDADDRIYLDWMAASEPRWGGSAEKMLAVAVLAQRHVDANPLLNLVLEKPNAYIGTRLWNGGDNVSALEVLDRALLLAPSPTDLKNAGYAAIATHQPERAIWYFSESYRFSGNLESLAERASALVALGHADWAKESLAGANSIDARDPDEIYSLAGALWRLGLLPDAEKQYLRILDINPRHESALVALGTLYLNAPIRPKKAQPIIDRLIEYYPNNARGWLLDAVGKPPAECHDYLRKYLELVDPNDPDERADIIRARRRLQEIEQGATKT